MDRIDFGQVAASHLARVTELHAKAIAAAVESLDPVGYLMEANGWIVQARAVGATDLQVCEAIAAGLV